MGKWRIKQVKCMPTLHTGNRNPNPNPKPKPDAHGVDGADATNPNPNPKPDAHGVNGADARAEREAAAEEEHFGPRRASNGRQEAREGLGPRQRRVEALRPRHDGRVHEVQLEVGEAPRLHGGGNGGADMGEGL